MPRYDGQGRIISGVGSGTVAIDGEKISGGGVACWLSDGVAIYQNSADDRLYKQPIGEPRQLVSQSGANSLAAGGGTWIAWLGFVGLHRASGFIGTGRLAGTSQEQDGRGAASRDGHIALTNGENQGFTIVNPDGVVTHEEPNAIALTMQVLGPTTAIWVDVDHRPHAIGFPSPPAVPPFDIFAVRAVRVGQDWYVLVGTHTGLVIYPWHSAEFGWKLDGLAFYPDCFVRRSVVDVVYSHGANELPHEIDHWRVDVSADVMTRLASEPTPIPTPEPEPEPEPTPMPEPESLLPTVQAVRAKYTEITSEVLGKMLNEIAWTHRDQGWGLNTKPSGNSCPQPRTGIRVAVDILHHKPTDTIWDCFRDAGGETIPAWGEAEPHGDQNRKWVAPVAPDGVTPQPDPEPEPEPQPEPPSSDVQLAILAELKKLTAHLGVR